MKHLSDEETLREAALSFQTPHSRSVFLKLAAAAGASLALPALATGAPVRRTAFGRAGAETGQVVDLVPTLANSFYASWGKGYASSAKTLKLQTRSVFPEFQPIKEIATAKGVKAQGGSMLVGIAGDQALVPQIARICQKDGVWYNPCFENPAWFTPQDVGDHYVTFLSPRSEEAAYQTAKFLFKSVGGEGQIIHIQGQSGPTDTFRTLGVRRAAKEFPGIKLVGNQRSQWTLDGGRKLMLAMLTAYPKAKGVFAQNDSIALGVLSVLEERKLKEMKVVGMDAIPEVLGKFNGPNFIGTFNSLGYWIAGYAVVNVFDALNGWKPSTPERLLASGGVLITKKNVTQLKKKIYTGPNPFNWTKMSRTLNPTSWDPQFDVLPFNPKVVWRNFPKDRPLNAAWNGAEPQIAKWQKTYRAHYKTGPLKTA